MKPFVIPGHLHEQDTVLQMVMRNSQISLTKHSAMIRMLISQTNTVGSGKLQEVRLERYWGSF
jgi:hypothetical protein